MRNWVATVCLLALGFSHSVLAGDPFADIKLVKLGSHSFAMQGHPGFPNLVNQGFNNNPSFVITRDSVVVIDPGGTRMVGQAVLRRIRAKTDKPVSHIFNTHIHGDHWLANHVFVEAFPDVKTIAHPNLIAQAQAGQDKFWLDTMGRMAGDAARGTRAVIPNTPARDGQEYMIGGVTFRVHVFEQAHTSTDLMVEIVDDQVVITGDVVSDRHVPFMGDASIKGLVAALNQAIAMNAKHYVPGHGAPGGKARVETILRYIATLRSEVKRHADAGKEDYEMKPQVVEKMKEFKDWASFDSEIGPQISKMLLLLEQESF